MKTQHNITIWLSRITALGVIVLLCAFYIVTINNMTMISAQTEAIKNGPYPVSVAAGQAETLLVQCKTITERPVFVRSEEALSNVEEALRDINSQLQEKIDYMAYAYADSSADTLTLQQDYEQLKTIQNEYLSLCRRAESDASEVRTFYINRLMPAVDDLLELDVSILNSTTASVDNLYGNVTRIGSHTMGIASALMAAVMISLVVYLSLLYCNRIKQNRLQEDVQQALALAQTANAAKSQFLSNMSHDIRTPMNAIVGLTAIAQSHIDEPARVKECLERITLSSKHLLGLINDVLDMGKIESGKIVLNEKTINLPTFTHDIVAIVQPTVQAKHLDFTVDLEDLAHENVRADATRLNQALMNLISNAVKYTPAGSVHLSIAEESSCRPGFRNYRFVVADTGIGMDPAFVEHMFDPFEREDREATQRIEGTGLGMAITKNIVSIMGGTIEVTSTPGEGSSFTVLIPLVPVSDEEPLPYEMFGSQDAALNDRVKHAICGRVLLVEDNEINRDIAEELIADTGAQVETAIDGVEAVERVINAKDGYFDLVFMDMQMPRMGGIEAAHAICEEMDRTNRVRPPIIAMTANVFDQDRERALKAGMDGFMMKPVDLGELARVLGKYLTHDKK